MIAPRRTTDGCGGRGAGADCGGEEGRGSRLPQRMQSQTLMQRMFSIVLEKANRLIEKALRPRASRLRSVM